MKRWAVSAVRWESWPLMPCEGSVRLQTRRWLAWCPSNAEFATAMASLADLKAVRQEHQHTINDVVLAMISGGVRSWLLTRGESIGSGSSLTALVPMSVTEDDGEPTSLGSQVAPHLQSLPIGEPNPLMRLHQVAYDTQAHKDSGPSSGCPFAGRHRRLCSHHTARARRSDLD